MMRFSKLKRTNQLLIILIIIWGALAIMFAIFDLVISELVVYEGQDLETWNWGNVGGWYGDNGRDALMILSFVIIIGSFFNSLKHQRISAYVAIILCLMRASNEMLENEQNNVTEMYIAIIFIIVLLIISRGKDWKRYRIVAFSCIILIFVAKNIISLINTLSGRARPYQVSSGEYAYTPWYIFTGGPGTSFPSGHTTMACSFLPLIFFIKEENIKKELKVIIAVGVIGWILFVAISRLLLGKHYPSDVLFPIMITSVITILLYKLFYENKHLFNFSEENNI